MDRVMGFASKCRLPALVAVLALLPLAGVRAQSTLPPAMPVDGAAMTLSMERGSAHVGPSGAPADVGGPALHWWLRRGPARLALGIVRLSPLTQADLPYGGPALAQSSTAFSLGLRWQVGERSTLYADASSARRLATTSDADLVAAKVGVEWAPSRSRLGFDKGALGLQLDSGYRMALRVRHGGLGVYMRGKF